MSTNHHYQAKEAQLNIQQAV